MIVSLVGFVSLRLWLLFPPFQQPVFWHFAGNSDSLGLFSFLKFFKFSHARSLDGKPESVKKYFFLFDTDCRAGFNHGMSRQRRWQIKRREAGLCAQCSNLRVTKVHCLKHAVAVRKLYQGKRKNNCLTRRLEQEAAAKLPVDQV